MRDLAILIPCKPLSEGKSRLAGVLSPPEREALCRSLLVKTIDLARQITSGECIAVVSRDPEVLSISRAAGLRPVTERGFDLNDALDLARASMSKQDIECHLLVMPTDLSLATLPALKAVLELEGDIVIVPDAAHAGTNILYLRGATANMFRFQYGHASFAAHLSQAKKNGWSVATHVDAALSFDLDNAEDYASLKKYDN